MEQLSEKTQLILKCVDFYINTLTDGGSKCPTIEQMKEIVKLDDIKTSLSAPKPAKS